MSQYKMSQIGWQSQALTRNTLDCDQSNVHSSRAVFSAISPSLFRSSSLYRRSAGDPPS